MTATPTPLRELPAKWRSEFVDVPTDGPADTAYTGAQLARATAKNYNAALKACADELEAALSARDEAGAVDWTRPIETVKGESARLAFPLDPAGADVLVHVEIGCGRWAYNLDGTPIQSNGYMPRIRNVATPPASGEAEQIVREFLEAEISANDAIGLACYQDKCAYADRLREALIRRLAAVAPAGMDGWIPVSERVPEFCKQVLLIAADVELGPGNRYTTDLYAGWSTPEGKWARWPHPFPPTHWQPLPTPPATAGKE